MVNHRTESTDAVEEKPPLFSSWYPLYALVLLNLLFLIVIFYIFTQAFK